MRTWRRRHVQQVQNLCDEIPRGGMFLSVLLVPDNIIEIRRLLRDSSFSLQWALWKAPFSLYSECTYVTLIHTRLNGVCSLSTYVVTVAFASYFTYFKPYYRGHRVQQRISLRLSLCSFVVFFFSCWRTRASWGKLLIDYRRANGMPIHAINA